MAAAQNIRSFITSPVLWTFAVKGANALSSFAVTILLARIAGAEIVGQFALALATATLVGLLPLRGLDVVALRTISGDLRERKHGEARGAARWLLMSVIRTTLPAVLLFTAAIMFTPVADRLDADHRALLAAAVGVLALPLFRFGNATARALDKPIWGQLLEAFPSLVLATILLGMTAGNSVPPLWLVVLLMFAGQLASSAIGFLLFRRSVKTWPGPVKPDPATIRTMRLAGWPIMGAMLLQQFSDWFLLAATTGFASAAETGAFRVVVQLMMLVAVACATAETYVAPRLSGDLRAGQVALAWRRHRRATALMVAVATPILLIAALVPEWVLTTLFGAEFASAAPAMRIMVIGQAVVVLRGPIGSMMIMGGHEQIQLMLVFASTVLVVVLGLLLIPRMGIEGAALTYTITIVARSAVAYVIARRLIRPHPAE